MQRDLSGIRELAENTRPKPAKTSPCDVTEVGPRISCRIRNLAFMSVKLLLKVGLGIDRPTGSSHRRFELPVAMLAYSNHWS